MLIFKNPQAPNWLLEMVFERLFFPVEGVGGGCGVVMK